MRWVTVLAGAVLALACGAAENMQSGDAGGDVASEGGSAGLAVSGGGTSSSGGIGGQGGTGGGTGGAGAAATDAGADAESDGPGDDASDSGEGGDVCLVACAMFVTLNCAGGPNSSAECTDACAALAKKGSACKTHSDEMYACFLAAGAQSMGCGSYGAQPHCGFCDTLVADLDKYCGFSTLCIP